MTRARTVHLVLLSASEQPASAGSWPVRLALPSGGAMRHDVDPLRPLRFERQLVATPGNGFGLFCRFLGQAICR